MNQDVVWIRPIITRTKSGVEIAETGVGGGWHDLSQGPEVDLKLGDVLDTLLQS